MYILIYKILINMWWFNCMSKKSISTISPLPTIIEECNEEETKIDPKLFENYNGKIYGIRPL